MDAPKSQVIPGICQHCRKSYRFLHTGRGLCGVCHKTPSIRKLYSTLPQRGSLDPVSVVRGALVNRLEEIIQDPNSRLRLLLDATEAAMVLATCPSPELARPYVRALADLAARIRPSSGSIDLLIELQRALFPEEYEPTPTDPPREGLIRQRGIRGVNTDRLAAFAQAVMRRPEARAVPA